VAWSLKEWSRCKTPVFPNLNPPASCRRLRLFLSLKRRWMKIKVSISPLSHIREHQPSKIVRKLGLPMQETRQAIFSGPRVSQHEALPKTWDCSFTT
jgi:hypothetical protein